MRHGSVIRKRVLGRRLRVLREGAGLTLEAAAPALDWSTSTLSRIETGQQAPTVHAVRSMLDLYDAGGPVWTEPVELTREVRRKGWWPAYGLGDDSYVTLQVLPLAVGNRATTGSGPTLQRTAPPYALGVRRCRWSRGGKPDQLVTAFGPPPGNASRKILRTTVAYCLGSGPVV
jgi:transcriptional regulator with XRE-family HTH domain